MKTKDSNIENCGDVKFEDTKRSMVDHPKHHTVNGKEAIDYIEKYDLDFNVGNVVDYLWRCGLNDKESCDMASQKAIWYFTRAVERAVKRSGGDKFPHLQAANVFELICRVMKDAGMSEKCNILVSSTVYYLGPAMEDSVANCIRTGRFTASPRYLAYKE